MPKQIIIAEQHRIAAVFSEDQIQELVVATGSHQVGDIYLGVVENVLPGIDAAFVNIGDAERNGFIHVTDLGPLRLRRSAGAITELLTPQQKVLVQVMKEPTGTKGPRLTGNITLPGRYLVLMPYGRGVNLSRRIRSENERNRLRALAILVKPPGMGLLVRTEAEGMAEEAVMEDLETLQKQWEAIQQEASSNRAPALLNRDDDFIQRVLREMYNADMNRIVVDSHTGLKRVKQQLLNWSGGKTPQGVLVDYHRDRIPVLEYFRVNAAIREALKPRVDLPSGGYIIIEPTEALTVVDVNSGSFTRSATARETVLWTNCEAATEIARQLRLRNIAGVIIVDFIDMDSRRDQLQVLEHFNKALKADKARPQIAQLSELGLVELTRKRQGQNIYELFGRPCPTCNGLGHLVHLPGEGETVPQPLIERSTTVLKDVPTRSIPETSSEPRRVENRYTPPAAPSEPQPTWQTEDLDSEYEAFGAPRDRDTSEIDLINHPNYQERSGLNNNRRRRRRRIGGEGDLGRSPAEGTSVSVPVNLKSTPEPVVIDTPELAEDLSASPREEWDDKSDRFLNARRVTAKRQSPKTVSPPEVISVEMTPEEQDVYALMGISPLILLNREVKNPKSAIIAVTLPGEKLETPNSELLENASAVPDFRENEPAEELSPEILSVSSASDPVSPLANTQAEEEIDEISATSEAEASAMDTRRRRRRRSSSSE